VLSNNIKPSSAPRGLHVGSNSWRRMRIAAEASGHQHGAEEIDPGLCQRQSPFGNSTSLSSCSCWRNAGPRLVRRSGRKFRFKKKLMSLDGSIIATHRGQERCAPPKGRIHLRRLVFSPSAFSLQSDGGPYILVHLPEMCRPDPPMSDWQAMFFSRRLPTHLRWSSFHFALGTFTNFLA